MRTVSVTEAEAKRVRIVQMFYDAMRKGTKLTLTYSFNRRPTARDIAEIEKSLNRLIVALLEGVGGKRLPRSARRCFHLDVLGMTRVDDGRDNDLIITIDFAKVFGDLEAAAELAL